MSSALQLTLRICGDRVFFAASLPKRRGLTNMPATVCAGARGAQTCPPLFAQEASTAQQARGTRRSVNPALARALSDLKDSHSTLRGFLNKYWVQNKPVQRKAVHPWCRCRALSKSPYASAAIGFPPLPFRSVVLFGVPLSVATPSTSWQ